MLEKLGIEENLEKLSKEVEQEIENYSTYCYSKS